MVRRPSGRVISVRLLHQSNALSPMLCRLSGRLTDRSAKQPLKASFWMFVSPSGSVTRSTCAE